MIIQWCLKGLSLRSDAVAKQIIDSRSGLLSNWWRTSKDQAITEGDKPTKLTAGNLDRHVNHFTAVDPATGNPFSQGSPFISLAAGSVERDAVAQTNYVHPALQTALWFGTEFGTNSVAYVYTCWVLVAPRPAVGIEAVAEEIRDLNTYRRYSAYQTEGEITAKVVVPDGQVRQCDKWAWDRSALRFQHAWMHRNPRFVRPEVLSNIRRLF